MLGRACVLESGLIDVPRYHVTAETVEAEIERMTQAGIAVNDELQAVAEQLPEDAPAEAKALLDVQLMLLHDSALFEAACDKVRSSLINVEWAISEMAEELAAQFRAIEDPYLKERGRDVEQVAERVLKALAGSQLSVIPPASDESLIFVAQDLQPADMLQLKGARGFVFERGGTHSHSAILARSLNVPAVVGVPGVAQHVQDGDFLILDGDNGEIIVAPDEAVLRRYRDRLRQVAEEAERLSRLVDVPCVTRDGCAVTLAANIEQPEEAHEALRRGAEAIGLFRSEFLFLNRSQLPNEEEQYRAYREALLAMQGRPVTVRTIDVGADKVLPAQALIPADASVLGRRAIRFSLAEPEIFLVQLRALLRASAHGPLRIMLPMLSQPLEVDAALTLLAQARDQLRGRGERIADHVPVGGMIEVPAAALSAGTFARKLAFLSIGTNDLVQYTLAIDRTDNRIAHLYDEFHPAVLRLIALTIRAARKAGVPVGVCGEMAGDTQATRLLLGMGLRSFSMSPARLLRVKRLVLDTDAQALVAQVRRLLVQDDQAIVRAGLAALGAGGQTS